MGNDAVSIKLVGNGRGDSLSVHANTGFCFYVTQDAIDHQVYLELKVVLPVISRALIIRAEAPKSQGAASPLTSVFCSVPFAGRLSVICYSVPIC